MAAASEGQLDQELDRLYQLPPSDFTAARDELAKQLRSEERRDLAEQVKQLRKPTVAVWLVNRLARERELDVQRLVKAGEALAKSQAALATGDRSPEFLQARQEEQRALERLVRAARELAEREGVSEAAIPRATETLRSASLSEEGRALLKRGRLTEELQPPGFEALAGSAAAERRPRAGQQQNATKKATAEKNERAERQQALKQARERVRELRAEERELATEARAARREAEQAELRAAELRSQADAAEAVAAAAEKERVAAESELEHLS